MFETLRKAVVKPSVRVVAILASPIGRMMLTSIIVIIIAEKIDRNAVSISQLGQKDVCLHSLTCYRQIRDILQRPREIK